MAIDRTRIQKIATRADTHRATLTNEEASKTALVLPFIASLGYDIFDPTEVTPELTENYGIKNSERVDYGINVAGTTAMLVECKPVGAKLEQDHAGQLFRYFSVSKCRVGILTDGIQFLFYSDLDTPNKMDSRPFFTFDLADYDKDDLDYLENFASDQFNADAIVRSAGELKYTKALLAEFATEFAAPSDDFVKLFASRVYDGRLVGHAKDAFSTRVHDTLNQYIKNEVNRKLRIALNSDDVAEIDAPLPEVVENVEPVTAIPADDGIVTTENEILAFNIVRSICAEVTPFDTVTIRDQKTYCGVLFTDNNRKPIIRFHFGAKSQYVTTFAEGNTTRHDIERIEDIFGLRDAILTTVKSYL